MPMQERIDNLVIVNDSGNKVLAKCVKLACFPHLSYSIIIALSNVFRLKCDDITMLM